MRRLELNRERLSAILGSVAIHGFVLSVILAAAYIVNPILIRRESSFLHVSWITLSSGTAAGMRESAMNAEQKPVAADVVPLQRTSGGFLHEEREAFPIAADRADRGFADLAVASDVQAPAGGRGSPSSQGSTPSGGKGSLTLQGGAISAPGDTAGSAAAAPRYLQSTHPSYPLIARLRGYEGVVLLAAEVRTDGRVSSLRIKRSSGYPVLDRCAYDSVLTWRFEPGRKMGKPIPMWVDVPVRFVLQDG